MSTGKLRHGQYYHFYIRGNDREPIFKEEQNYLYFLDLYRRYIHPIANLYAYCLLPTHFHLLLEIKQKDQIDPMYFDEGTLWMQFRRCLGTYTKEINKLFQRSGHLCYCRYSKLNGLRDDQFYNMITYIHQKPENHGIVSDYRYWPFSSYFAYLKRDRRSMLARRIFSDDGLYTTILDMHQEKILDQGLIKL